MAMDGDDKVYGNGTNDQFRDGNDDDEGRMKNEIKAPNKAFVKNTVWHSY